MNAIEQLTQSLFKKSTIEECSLHELQSLSRQYPYFAIGHLLLAEKIKTLDSSLYNHQLEKASLYFHNPLWLDYIINKEKNEAQLMEETAAAAELEQGETTAEEELVELKIYGNSEIPASINETDSSDTLDDDNSPDLKIEALPDTKNDLLFEPYHTVDYFASQGIKPEQDEKPKDRFGQQLRSFTDWLKTMKRLPEKENSQKMEVAIEQKVQSLAEFSLEDRDVVTETMAEVWIKQGDNQKAMEIYNKLSLLNPSKSAYFAAKIDQLKELI